MKIRRLLWSFINICIENVKLYIKNYQNRFNISNIRKMCGNKMNILFKNN